MGLFFGTDGLRGIVNEDLSFDIAYKCGNALSTLKESPTVLIGADTRISGEYLTLAVASGVMAGGGNVVDLGLVPTAGVAYLTRALGADYGVVISASHNPKEYNGIKIFDSQGYKLGDKEEERVERCFIHEKVNGFPHIGRFKKEPNLVKKYEKFLLSSSENSLKGLTVVLDGANGAASRIAPSVFRKLGAKVVASNCSEDGLKINERCGALYPETLVGRVKRYKADLGFAFDGDADRLMVVDDKGNVIDGDMIIYMLAKYFKKYGRLSGDIVVGTSHTNMAIEVALKEHGVGFIRTDIGDKYVLAKLVEKNLSLGGEQSGHIILKDLHTTGDGILSAIAVANMLLAEKATISDLLDVKLYPQVNLNIPVDDKLKIMNSQVLAMEVARLQNTLGGKGRVMVRASGTEPKIRVMVESENKDLNLACAEELKKIVKRINEEV